MRTKKSNRYCQGLCHLGISRARSLANLVMALSSYEAAHSPTELSLSPVYHYQYGSISKAVSSLAKDSKEYEQVCQLARRFCLAHYQPSVPYIVLQTDASPLCKAHSERLPDRTYIAISNNVIRGNKPLSVGYQLSCINLAAGDGWSLPLLADRVRLDQTASECAAAQVTTLLTAAELLFQDQTVINLLDSSYGNASYLCPAYQFDNLVNVVRLRGGSKVWTQAQGARRIYGEKHYLVAQSQFKTYKRHPKTGQAYQVWQQSIFERPADETLQLEAWTKKGRALVVELWRWNDLKIRTKEGYNMKDKLMDILAVRVKDAQTGQLVFDREMYLSLCGQAKDQISTKQAYELYRKRYDIEPYFRFAKQKLMLDKYQTPELEHLDNWLVVVQLAAWLLYVMRQEAHYVPKKWQQYEPKEKQAAQGQALSMAQCRKAAEKLFLTFDPNPFKPLKSKKGRGRQKGQSQGLRPRYRVVKKNRNKSKIKLKTEKLE